MEKLTKKSEARVLVYLDSVDSPLKFARQMSIKLNMDYAYLLGRLRDMKEKNWIKPIRREQKVFYENKFFAPVQEAYDLLQK